MVIEKHGCKVKVIWLWFNLVSDVLDDKAKYTDWSQRADIKAELKVDLIMLLAKFGYPQVSRDEVYKEIFEQAENFKKIEWHNGFKTS